MTYHLFLSYREWYFGYGLHQVYAVLCRLFKSSTWKPRRKIFDCAIIPEGQYAFEDKLILTYRQSH